MEQYAQYDRSGGTDSARYQPKPAPVLNDYSAHRGSEGGGLTDKWSKLYSTHPKRVWGAGACCCICLLIIIVVGSLAGTVASTTNAKLLQFVATFDELCVITDNTIPASFHIELDNPSSIGVSANPFTLEIRRLADNMDATEGEPAMEVTLPEIIVPGGLGTIDFSCTVKLVDMAVSQRIASEFLSNKPVVVLLKAAVPVNALGLGATVDVAFPFYLNNSMRDPGREPGVSLESATFVSDDAEKLVIDVSMRVNGSDKFIAKVPSMSLGALYTDKETVQGPNTAVVADVVTQPFTFQLGWNYLNFSATLPGVNASITGGAFKELITRQPLTLQAFGRGGNAECWMQRFLSGLAIQLLLQPRPSQNTATFQKVDIDVRSLDSASMNMGLTLNIGDDLRVRGKLPPLTVGVKNQFEDVMLTANVNGLSLLKGANPFDVALSISDVPKLTKVISDIANKVPTRLSIGAVGTSTMARIAARYQIVSPFHGYVDPFAASTPSPTPPPPPAQQALLRGGGLYKLEVTSNDPDALVLAIEFALPPIASMTWDLPAYTLQLAEPGQATHGSIVVDANVVPAVGAAPSVVKLTATVRVTNYAAAARTINAILAQELYVLSIKGTGTPNDVIGRFLAQLEPITVSRVPPTAAPPGVTTIGGGSGDAMPAMMAAAGFKLNALSSTGLDNTGRWAVIEAAFSIANNATININLVPPPQLSIIHSRPVLRGGGEAKLVDVELRSVTGTQDAYTATAAVTADNRTSTDLAINMLLKQQQVSLYLQGTSSANSLFAKLLAQVRYRIVLEPPAPTAAKNMSMAQAVLLGMKYESSGPDNVVIGIDFDATLPIKTVIDVGTVHVDIVHMNAPILQVDVAQLKLVPDANRFSLDATVNGRDRNALEDAVAKAVFLPPADQPPQQFLMRATIAKAEWGASRTIPIEFLFDMPPGPSAMETIGKNPNNPIKCTELESLRICPAPGSEDTECLNLEQLRMGGASASALSGLLSSCSLGIDLGLFIGNPTTLDFRIDELDLKIQFDDRIGVSFLSYDPKVGNVLGIIDTDFKGAQVGSLDVVRIPITVLPTADTSLGTHEMCIRAGWNMLTNGKILVDLVDGLVRVRLDKFPLTVRVSKKGIPAENIPKNQRVKCVDYLANINIAVEPLGRPDKL